MTNAIAFAAAVVELDDSTGTPVDISAGVTGGRVEVRQLSESYANLADDWAHVVDLVRRGRAVLSVLTSPAAATAHGYLRGWLSATTPGARTLTISTPTAATGSLEVSGEFRIAALTPVVEFRNADGQAQETIATLLLDGELSVAVIA